ncbi:MAG: NAD+ synthase [Methanolinea sp.]|nr:NAD+ synthase [Methanolinea sp.]
METDRGCALGRIEQLIRYSFWTSKSEGIVVGVSGGVDSAVTAAMCCRAIGGELVVGLCLPSEVTSPGDMEDAEGLCKSLGMEYRAIPITPILNAYRAMPDFEETPYLMGNLMARTRMAILFYHANRDRRLVCGTSNRTEYLLGYSTKYGDSAADIQPILHLYKTEILEIAGGMGIPSRILSKSPSANLWPGQTDEGEIGLSYPEIDAALMNLEKNGGKSSSKVEERVLEMVRKSEHKRLHPPSLL